MRFVDPAAQEVLTSLDIQEQALLDFEAHGREAIEECRKQSPLGYVKVLGHLVPREMKVQHSQVLKTMSDEDLYQIPLIRTRGPIGAVRWT
jgi:hypothetical protein